MRRVKRAIDKRMGQIATAMAGGLGKSLGKRRNSGEIHPFHSNRNTWISGLWPPVARHAKCSTAEDL
jgi:hypothetical protein